MKNRFVELIVCMGKLLQIAKRDKYASAVNQMEHICVLGIDLFIT